MPIDIAPGQLQASSIALAGAFPGMPVISVCADYTRPLDVAGLIDVAARRRIIYFPGSTIGNFTVPEAAEFLKNARSLAGAGGGLLIGVDLKKDTADAVVAKAKICLLDYLSCVYESLDLPWSVQAMRIAAPGTTVILGSTQSASRADAALSALIRLRLFNTVEEHP